MKMLGVLGEASLSFPHEHNRYVSSIICFLYHTEGHSYLGYLGKYSALIGQIPLCMTGIGNRLDARITDTGFRLSVNEITSGHNMKANLICIYLTLTERPKIAAEHIIFSYALSRQDVSC